MHERTHYLRNKFFSTDLYADDIRCKSRSRLENTHQLSWCEFHTSIFLSNLQKI